MTPLVLLAPMSGWALPLGQLPDPVFAGGMAGDGVAIDPLDGELRAPCDGVVVLAGKARHAVSLRHASGIEVLMHVGIDTVALHGQGFELLVADGQAVAAGELLLRFDLDRIARDAKSAVTPVLVTGGGDVVMRSSGRLVRVGEALLQVAAARGSSVRDEPVEPHTVHRTFRVPFDHGLHARPAAQLVNALRGLEAVVELHFGPLHANARSATSLMALGTRTGDAVEAIARGRDAAAAIDALASLLAPAATEDSPPIATDPAPSELHGRTAVPGLAIGTAVTWRVESTSIPRAGTGEVAETRALEAALARVAAHFNRPGAGDLAAAHLALLEDPELDRTARAALARGDGAAHAWHEATHALAVRLGALPDARMRERAADLRDLDAVVRNALAGRDLAEQRALPADAIVFADELLPSHFAALDPARLAGIVMARGGPTSHVALLAAARGIPTLVAAGAGVLAVRDGQAVALDASGGVARLDPPLHELEALRTRVRQRATRAAEDLLHCTDAAITRDGTRITVHANLGAVGEARPAIANGAEGCGLLRTEFLFLDRADAPGEDEQHAVYAAAAAALGTLPLTIRTLDVGGDKPLAYLPLPREENPALGVRGLRVGLREPALLRTQLRALLRAAAGAPNLCVMLPMVNDLREFRAARALWREEAHALGLARLPALGVMIETPAAALLADQLASEADFLSIGSNDLSQYVLAMDRGHPELAASLDALHPAVLRAIARVADAGRAAGRSVSVCGGMGSDSDALPLLVGLGIRDVSAVPGAIPRVKRELRALDAGACAALAQRALACESAEAVRALLHESAPTASATPAARIGVHP